jgi:hypothetical protein
MTDSLQKQSNELANEMAQDMAKDEVEGRHKLFCATGLFVDPFDQNRQVQRNHGDNSVISWRQHGEQLAAMIDGGDTCAASRDTTRDI